MSSQNTSSDNASSSLSITSNKRVKKSPTEHHRRQFRISLTELLFDIKVHLDRTDCAVETLRTYKFLLNYGIEELQNKREELRKDIEQKDPGIEPQFTLKELKDAARGTAISFANANNFDYNQSGYNQLVNKTVEETWNSAKKNENGNLKKLDQALQCVYLKLVDYYTPSN